MQVLVVRTELGNEYRIWRTIDQGRWWTARDAREHDPDERAYNGLFLHDEPQVGKVMQLYWVSHQRGPQTRPTGLVVEILETLIDVL